MAERLLLGYIILGLVVVSVFTYSRVYVEHEYAFYTELDQIPDQVGEFEAKYLPFLVSPDEETEE